MTRIRIFTLAASLMWLIAMTGSHTACAQSTTRDSEFEEDFYQPVQELWNTPPIETPEAPNSFPTNNISMPSTEPAPVGVTLKGPSFPAYTQQGPYEEIAAPMYGDGALSAEGCDEFGSNATMALPNLVGPTYEQPAVDQPVDEFGSSATMASPNLVCPTFDQPVVGQPAIVGTVPGTVSRMPAPVVVTQTAPTTTAPIAVAAQPGCGSNRTMFVRWDALYGTVNQNDDTIIGSPDAAGVYITNGILFPYTNSLSTGIFDTDGAWGNRVEFGEMSCNGGWMISVFDWDQRLVTNSAGGAIQFDDPIGMLLGYADGNDDSIDDDVDGDHVYGRYGVDLGTPDPNNLGMFLPIYDGVIDATAPADTGDLLTWVPTFENLQAASRIEMTGFEIMKAWQRQRSSRFGFVHHWMAGVRFLDIDEEFALNASGGFFDPTTIDARIENFVIGPQVGTEFCRRVCNWRVGGTLRLLLGINFQRGEQFGSYAVSGTPGGQNQPVNLYPGAFSSVADDSAFSPLFEWRLDAAYDLGAHIAARIGYTGFVVGGIGRASNSIEYTLPSFGMSLNDDDVIVFNGLTLGLEAYF